MNTKIKPVFSDLEIMKKKFSENLMKGKKTLVTEEEFIATGITYTAANHIPYDAAYPVNSPNCNVTAWIQMLDQYGNPVSGGFASNGNYLKILQVKDNLIFALVPTGDGTENGPWYAGYFAADVFPFNSNNAKIYPFQSVMDFPSDKVQVVNANGDNPFTYDVNQGGAEFFLYEAPDIGEQGNYACILFDFNNGVGPFTGYVNMYGGRFTRNITNADLAGQD